MLNKKIEIFGRQVLVSAYLTGEARSQKQQSLQKRRLFIRNIPAHWDTERLNHEFQKLGEIHQAYIIQKSPENQSNSKKTKNKSGFGYVITQNIDLAEKLVEIGNVTFGDVKLIIKRHTDAPESKKIARKMQLPVAAFKPAVNQNQMGALFASEQQVIQAQIFT